LIQNIFLRISSHHRELMNIISLLLLSLPFSKLISFNEKTEVHPSYDADLFRKDKKVFFVNGEFLYWIVSEGGLDYAIKMKKAPWGALTQASGHYKRATFDWDPGVRLNVGYFNAPHYWDLYLQYTYFKGCGKSSTHVPESGLSLNGTWPQPDPTSALSLQKAESQIDLWLNLLELLVSRRFHPNPHLRVKMFGGFNMLWIRQSWEVDYRDFNDNTSHLRNYWRYTAPGIKLGMSLDWFLGRAGIYLTSKSSLSCFSGYYLNVSRENSTYSQNGYQPGLPLKDSHYQDVRLVPQFQTMLGPSWQWSFARYRTEIFLGYELNLWANINELYRSSEGSTFSSKQTYINSGVVGIQGITLRVNLDF